MKEGRTGLNAVDGLVGALCLVFLLGYDRGDGAAGLGVPGDLMKVSTVVVVNVCCWEERRADWEFYHGGGVM
jgi:hypothetical protein